MTELLLRDELIAGAHLAKRQIIFYKVINALADGLRSVFVPYFRHLQNAMVTHLSGETSHRSNATPKKKRKTSAVLPQGEQSAAIQFQVSMFLSIVYLFIFG